MKKLASDSTFHCGRNAIFEKIYKKFAHKKLKQPPPKVAQKYSSFSPIAAQTAQTVEFCFQKVAYRITVYSIGA